MVISEVSDELLSIFDSVIRVAALTGAGVSAESGVPTFRSGGGSEIWTWRGGRVTELSSAQLIAADPRLVWEWFDYRRALIKHCVPNAGHTGLAQWERRFERFTLITQNVDRLHREAGSMHSIRRRPTSLLFVN